MLCFFFCCFCVCCRFWRITCTQWRYRIFTPHITAGTLVPSSVNGDIAIQWEWSNFDTSQNPNPLTDYDKTLHSWLRPWDEHVTQNLCQSAVRERLAKYVKYKASLFYFIFLPVLAYWSNPCMKFHAHMAQNTRCDVRKCIFGVHTMADNILGFEFPKNRQKWPVIGTFKQPQTASKRMTS